MQVVARIRDLREPAAGQRVDILSAWSRARRPLRARRAPGRDAGPLVPARARARLRERSEQDVSVERRSEPARPRFESGRPRARPERVAAEELPRGARGRERHRPLASQRRGSPPPRVLRRRRLGDHEARTRAGRRRGESSAVRPPSDCPATTAGARARRSIQNAASAMKASGERSAGTRSLRPWPRSSIATTRWVCVSHSAVESHSRAWPASPCSRTTGPRRPRSRRSTGACRRARPRATARPRRRH